MSLRSSLRRVYDNSSISVQTKLRMIYGRIPDRLKLGKEFAGYREELPVCAGAVHKRRRNRTAGEVSP